MLLDRLDALTKQSAKAAAVDNNYLKELLRENLNATHNYHDDFQRLERSLEKITCSTVKADGVQLSVIVPVFNVEKYLPECLNSILLQDVDSMEVICVNDGSTDGSEKILLDYAQKDSRIRVFSRFNHGLGATRNFGLLRARGEYVCFIDSDDWLKENTLGTLYNEAHKNELDILYFDGEIVYETPELERDFPAFKTTWSLSRQREYSVITDGQSLWCKMRSDGAQREVTVLQLFRRAFLLDNNLMFPEGMLHEDTVFDIACMALAQRVSHRKLNTYIYRIRPNSITTKTPTEYRVYSLFRCWFEVALMACSLPLRAETAKEVWTKMYSIRSATLQRYNASGLNIDNCTQYFNTATRALFKSIILGK